jgi:hypothetical protein
MYPILILGERLGANPIAKFIRIGETVLEEGFGGA